MLISFLETKKNLLAFSGGVDSTSLFFILLENKIPFDIAIVNYNQREQATQEVEYAIELARKYEKKCYVKKYNNEKFSEKIARDFRYHFFDEIIENEKYETLITAHQLNDKMEWFMMQLARGAGVVELIGLEQYSTRKNYQIFRPLLDYTKDELIQYLQNNQIQYFIDETNSDVKYQRNYIRTKYATEFVNEYKDGLKKSFTYLQNDVTSIETLFTKTTLEELSVANFKIDDNNIKLRFIDRELKNRGVLLSKDMKDEILRQNEIVVSHSFVVVIEQFKVYIAPFVDNVMKKEFKDWCRVHKIPKKIRPYLFSLDSSLRESCYRGIFKKLD
jgi:tRNA(Ile)-lysidine synthase